MRDLHTRHPRAADLVSWATGADDERVAVHVAGCERCRRLVNDWRLLGRQAGESMREEADKVFTAGRLSRQRSEILGRIRRGGRARVLLFPGAGTSAPGRRWLGGEGRRWAAAAALAGLFVGTLAGRFLLDPHAPGPTTRADAPAGVASRPAFTAPPVSDEAFLVELDAAVFSSSPRALWALDALTPDVER